MKREVLAEQLLDVTHILEDTVDNPTMYQPEAHSFYNGKRVQLEALLTLIDSEVVSESTDEDLMALAVDKYALTPTSQYPTGMVMTPKEMLRHCDAAVIVKVQRLAYVEGLIDGRK